MPPAWKQWVVKCLLSGTAVPTILTTLAENGFSPDTIKKVLGANLPSNYQFSPSSSFYEKLAKSAIARVEKAKPLAEPSDIQLFSYDDFLSSQECDALEPLQHVN